MTSKEIRQSFLDFFEQKGHKIVPSAPMVIKDDPTLMFTNAGMNQFKNIILGNDPIKYPRIADSQKCLRVSGKHNDLEEVGHDTYHHTMFEMLGNWSFGDYFKAEAIAWAWEYLTEVLKLDKNRFYVTVFEGDLTPDPSPKERGLEGDRQAAPSPLERAGVRLERDNEAAAIWEQFVPKDRILNGNKKDNFWEMGDTGPCGPCSEIHIDLRTDEERAKISGAELVNKDNPLVIEIWNNVFMQYNRKADGSLEGLPNKVIDTGMGFERLCMAVQGKRSNYDTDVFTPIIAEIEKVTGYKYQAPPSPPEGGDVLTPNGSPLGSPPFGGDGGAIAMRVIADHIRTIAFSITDGQLPGNAKAGYVIRRILRRAVRYGYTFLGQRSAFMYKLIPALIDSMGAAYPELSVQKTLIEKVIKEEEESFLRTLETGIRLLDKVMADTQKVNKTEISGVDAFTLYDTYGFPLDLTELILRENNLTLNNKEFDAEMQKQKERARNAAAVETGDWEVVREGETEFVGYDSLECETQILRYRKVSQKGKEFYQVVLSKTPFYAEMGGQVGDSGVLTSPPALSKGEGAVADDFAGFYYRTTDESNWHNNIENAKDMRHNPTEAENLLWENLRNNVLKYKFRRQHLINNFIVDFVCIPLKLVVEVDGEYHNDEEQKKYDTERTKILKELGFQIIRFTNEEVLTNVANVKAKINSVCEEIARQAAPSPLERAGGEVVIFDTKKENNLPIHLTNELPEDINATFIAKVNVEKRRASEANHSATHLLHEALREVLGTHVEQKGSFVSPNVLRFDFSHFQKMTKEELRAVERLTNKKIRANILLCEHRDVAIKDAKEMGAMALFGEKYGETVRVINFGSSTELCGGTHVQATGEIGLLKIVSESSIAAGIRRIEAVTAENAEIFVTDMQDAQMAVHELLNNVPDVKIAIKKLFDENADLKKKVEDYIVQQAAEIREKLLQRAENVGDVKVIRHIDTFSPDLYKHFISFFKDKFPTEKFLFVGGTVYEEKPLLTVFLSQAMIDAGFNASTMVREAAKEIQGGGGGQAFLATAGGKNPAGIEKAVAKVIDLLH